MQRKRVMIRGKYIYVQEIPINPKKQESFLEATLVFLPEEERTYVEGRTSNIHS